MSSNIIFENYGQFLSEHDELKSVDGAMSMLVSDGAFRSYISSLTEGLDTDQQDTIMRVSQRQREVLLEESVQLGPSANVIGYAVSYFPILTDIYAEPILSKACTVYPVNKGMITIPRAQLSGTVLNPDGTSVTHRMPRFDQLVRGGEATVSVAPGASASLAEDGSGNALVGVRLNRRYTILSTVTDGTTTWNAFVRPDARGQLSGTVDLAAGEVATVVGHVDWDNMTVQYSVTTSGSTVITSGDFDVRYSPTSGDIGRTKVKLEITGWDVDIDTKDDFEIELLEETIQDYKDIYNIDLVRHLSEAIKSQILTNKDHDISWLLRSAETDIIANGAKGSVNLADFDGTTKGAPRNMIDVMKNTVPVLNRVSRSVYQNFRGYPQYLLTSNKTASVLESMQDQVADMRGVKEGKMGPSSPAMNFANQTVLASPAIDDNKIYTVYKPSANNLAKSVLIDLVYKPIYIQPEVTNSLKRTFVKSRTAVEIGSTDAVGLVEFDSALTTMIGNI